VLLRPHDDYYLTANPAFERMIGSGPI
jgi:hypothetical protein